MKNRSDKKTKYFSLLRMVAFCLIVCMLMSETSWANGFASLSLSSSSQNTFQLSRADGSIREQHVLANQTAQDFLILDVHADPKAQRNIFNILNTIEAQRGPIDLHLEANWENISTQAYHLYPRKEILKETILPHLEKGQMSGAEYFALLTNKTRNLLPLETRATYLECREQMLKALNSKEQMFRHLDRRKKGWSKASHHFLSPDMLELIAIGETLRSSERGFGETLLRLQKLSDDVGLSHVSETEYPLTSALIKEMQSPSWSRGRMIKEGQRVMKAFLKHANSSLDLNRWLSLWRKFKSGEMSSQEYLLHLRAEPTDMIQKRSTQTFLEQLTQQSETESLDPTLLMAEIDALMNELAHHLSGTSRNMKLYQQGRLNEVLTDMALLELLPTQWQTIKHQKNENLAPYQEAISFYEQVDKRDQMMANSLKKNSLKKNKRTRVIIIGGFHEEALKKELQSQGRGYYVIAPSDIDITGTRDRYFNLLEQQSRSSDVGRAGESRFEAQTLSLRPMLAENGELLMSDLVRKSSPTDVLRWVAALHGQGLRREAMQVRSIYQRESRIAASLGNARKYLATLFPDVYDDARISLITRGTYFRNSLMAKDALAPLLLLIFMKKKDGSFLIAADNLENYSAKLKSVYSLPGRAEVLKQIDQFIETKDSDGSSDALGRSLFSLGLLRGIVEVAEANAFLPLESKQILWLSQAQGLLTTEEKELAAQQDALEHTESNVASLLQKIQTAKEGLAATLLEDPAEGQLIEIQKQIAWIEQLNQMYFIHHLPALALDSLDSASFQDSERLEAWLGQLFELITKDEQWQEVIKEAKMATDHTQELGMALLTFREQIEAQSDLQSLRQSAEALQALRLPSEHPISLAIEVLLAVPEEISGVVDSSGSSDESPKALESPQVIVDQKNGGDDSVPVHDETGIANIGEPERGKGEAPLSDLSTGKSASVIEPDAQADSKDEGQQTPSPEDLIAQKRDALAEFLLDHEWIMNDPKAIIESALLGVKNPHIAALIEALAKYYAPVWVVSATVLEEHIWFDNAEGGDQAIYMTPAFLRSMDPETLINALRDMYFSAPALEKWAAENLTTQKEDAPYFLKPEAEVENVSVDVEDAGTGADGETSEGEETPADESVAPAADSSGDLDASGTGADSGVIDKTDVSAGDAGVKVGDSTTMLTGTDEVERAGADAGDFADDSVRVLADGDEDVSAAGVEATAIDEGQTIELEVSVQKELQQKQKVRMQSIANALNKLWNTSRLAIGRGSLLPGTVFDYNQNILGINYSNLSGALILFDPFYTSQMFPLLPPPDEKFTHKLYEIKMKQNDADEKFNENDQMSDFFDFENRVRRMVSQKRQSPSADLKSEASREILDKWQLELLRIIEHLGEGRSVADRIRNGKSKHLDSDAWNQTADAVGRYEKALFATREALDDISDQISEYSSHEFIPHEKIANLFDLAYERLADHPHFVEYLRYNQARLESIEEIAPNLVNIMLLDAFRWAYRLYFGQLVFASDDNILSEYYYDLRRSYWLDRLANDPISSNIETLLDHILQLEKESFMSQEMATTRRVLRKPQDFRHLPMTQSGVLFYNETAATRFFEGAGTVPVEGGASEIYTPHEIVRNYKEGDRLILFYPTLKGYPTALQEASFLEDAVLIQALLPSRLDVLLGTTDENGLVRVFKSSDEESMAGRLQNQSYRLPHREISIHVYRALAGFLTQSEEVFRGVVVSKSAQQMQNEKVAHYHQLEAIMTKALREALPEYALGEALEPISHIVTAYFKEDFTAFREMRFPNTRKVNQSTLQSWHDRHLLFSAKVMRMILELLNQQTAKDHFEQITLPGFPESEPVNWFDPKAPMAVVEEPTSDVRAEEIDEASLLQKDAEAKESVAQDFAIRGSSKTHNLGTAEDLLAFARQFIEDGGKATFPALRKAWVAKDKAGKAEQKEKDNAVRERLRQIQSQESPDFKALVQTLQGTDEWLREASSDLQAEAREILDNLREQTFTFWEAEWRQRYTRALAGEPSQIATEILALRDLKALAKEIFISDGEKEKIQTLVTSRSIKSLEELASILADSESLAKKNQPQEILTSAQAIRGKLDAFIASAEGDDPAGLREGITEIREGIGQKWPTLLLDLLTEAVSATRLETEQDVAKDPWSNFMIQVAEEIDVWGEFAEASDRLAGINDEWTERWEVSAKRILRETSVLNLSTEFERLVAKLDDLYGNAISQLKTPNGLGAEHVSYWEEVRIAYEKMASLWQSLDDTDDREIKAAIDGEGWALHDALTDVLFKLVQEVLFPEEEYAVKQRDQVLEIVQAASKALYLYQESVSAMQEVWVGELMKKAIFLAQGDLIELSHKRNVGFKIILRYDGLADDKLSRPEFHLEMARDQITVEGWRLQDALDFEPTHLAEKLREPLQRSRDTNQAGRVSARVRLENSRKGMRALLAIHQRESYSRRSKRSKTVTELFNEAQIFIRLEKVDKTGAVQLYLTDESEGPDGKFENPYSLKIIPAETANSLGAQSKAVDNRPAHLILTEDVFLLLKDQIESLLMREAVMMDIVLDANKSRASETLRLNNISKDAPGKIRFVRRNSVNHLLYDLLLEAEDEDSEDGLSVLSMTDQDLIGGVRLIRFEEVSETLLEASYHLTLRRGLLAGGLAGLFEQKGNRFTWSGQVAERLHQEAQALRLSRKAA